MTSVLSFATTALLALARTATSAPTAAKTCIQLQIPVHVEAEQYHYDQPEVNSDIDAMEWTVNVTTWSAPSWIARQTSPVHINQIFSISAELCVPSKKTSKASILHIATAGQGFDRRYFNAQVQPGEYNYIDAAISKGYSVLAYDRIGTGNSEKPDAYDIVQIPTDIEILIGLTKMARSGTLISSSHISNNDASSLAAMNDYEATKIVHVGHAYGSYIMFIMLGQHADISDAALMTGLLINDAMLNNTLTVLNYNHAFPRENDPVRFADWGPGYFVLDNKRTIQKLFFQKRSMDPALLDYADAIKQPESVGTYSSEGNSTLAPAPGFKGPVMFFTGEFDNYICNGDCRGVYAKSLTESFFPNAKQVTPCLQPGGGHATGLSKGAREGYEVQLEWLESNGL